MPETIKVTAIIQINGINPFVGINAEQAAVLKPGWRKPMPVLVKINAEPNIPWRTNMMPTGKGDFYLYLHGGMRKTAQTKVGDTVTISLGFDKAYLNGPLHLMPEWFQTALNNNPTALTNWMMLTPSRQKEILRYFYGLKSDEAKNRNLIRVLNVLGGNNDRFMGREWVAGK